MPFSTPEFDAIQEAILRDIANQVPAANVGEDSDFAVRAAAVAAAVEGLYQHQSWLARQILPDLADTEWLERHASLRGLTRKAARAASGMIVLTGQAGAPIPQGTQARSLAGRLYATSVAGSLDGAGEATLAAQAVEVGAAGNLAALSGLTLVSPPAGVDSAATAGAMTGGADPETDRDLRARLLFRIRNPPHGGAAFDYVSWATEVDGVAAAWCLPLRRGLGTVDVVILPEGGGLPSGPLIAAVAAHIEALRPVTADVLVSGPTAINVEVTAALLLSDGASLVDAGTQAAALLAAYFATLSPGATAYRSKILAILATLSGVVDVALADPADNVASLVDDTHIEMPFLGTVTLT